MSQLSLAQSQPKEKSIEWPQLVERMEQKNAGDRVEGISYLISGSLAMAGGLAGQELSNDPLEKGVYTLFQSIGVASIGFGIYRWKVGNEDRWAYESAALAPGLSNEQRMSMMRSFYRVKREREKQERFMRALTHGLIAALNVYGALQQENESLKNGLIFLGGVNALAAVSFAF